MWQTYTMRIGDKLDKIATKFGMTLAKLKEVNGIFGKAKAKPGLPLLVPGQKGGEPLDMAALPEQPQVAQQARPAEPATSTTASQTHTVRKGETLPMIAKRYGTSVAELKRANHLRNDKLSAGQHLAVSVPIQKQTKGDAKVAKADAPAAKQAKPGKTSLKTVRYTIRRGDTLTSIAKQFKVDKDDLLRWNRVSPTTLKPGKTLTIQLAQNP